MPPVIGNLIAIAAVAALVFFAARSLWRAHRSGSSCSCCGGSSQSGCGGNSAGCPYSCPSCYPQKAAQPKEERANEDGSF